MQFRSGRPAWRAIPQRRSRLRSLEASIRQHPNWNCRTHERGLVLAAGASTGPRWAGPPPPVRDLRPPPEVEAQLEGLLGLGDGRLARTGFVVDHPQLAGSVPLYPIGPARPGDPPDLEFELPLRVGWDGLAARPLCMHLGDQVTALGLVGVVEDRRSEVRFFGPNPFEHFERLAQGVVRLPAFDRLRLGSLEDEVNQRSVMREGRVGVAG